MKGYKLDGFECDLLSIDENDFYTEYEIKVDKSDYKIDFLKSRFHGPERIFKHNLIKEGKRVNAFYFVVPGELIIDIPEYCGLISFADGELRIIKKAPLITDTKFKHGERSRVPFLFF